MCRKIELGNLFFIPQRDIQLFPNKGYKLSTRLRVNIIPFQAPVYIFIEYCIREFDTQRKEREREIRATEKWSTNDCILNTKRSSTGEKISQLPMMQPVQNDKTLVFTLDHGYTTVKSRSSVTSLYPCHVPAMQNFHRDKETNFILIPLLPQPSSLCFPSHK